MTGWPPEPPDVEEDPDDREAQLADEGDQRREDDMAFDYYPKGD